ncbi:MAG: hypothetical protein ACJAZ1_002961 [Yoonia sp.]
MIQPLDPWLDQVALPLLYATGSDAQVAFLENVAAHNKIKKLLKLHDPFKRMIYQKRRLKVRDMFDRTDLPRRERAIRNKIKSAGFWMR